MTWLEISVEVDGEAAEAVHAIFEHYGEGGAVFERTFLASDEASEYLENPSLTVKAFIPADDTAKRAALEQALWHLGQLYPIPPPRICELTEADWAEAWKKGYDIQRLGRRLVIVPTWLEYSPAPGEVVIRLEPGMAFGTGLHPTTRLCAAALEDYLRPGDHVLDVGTGSGILAIAAAKLGAATVRAVDIDPVAVRVAHENAALNGVESVLEIEVGSAEPGLGQFDVITANILANVIVDLTGDLVTCLAPSGYLIAGGILEAHEASVLERWRAAGLIVVDRSQFKDWISLVAQKSNEDRSLP